MNFFSLFKKQDRVMIFIDGSNLYHVLMRNCGRYDLYFSKFATKLANKRKAKLNRTKKYIVNIYTTLLLLSMFWWMLDQYFCNYIKSYQLHAFWHVGTALSLGLGLLSFII